MSTANILLTRALAGLESMRLMDLFRVDAATLPEEIRTYLSTHSDDADEPVAYLFDADSYCDHAPIKDELVQSLPKGMLRQKIKNVRPLYTRPSPSRKPMTEEEIDSGFRYGDVGYMNGFFEGVRFAERHHGIGGDDD